MLSVCVTVLVLRLHHKDPFPQPPAWLENLLLKKTTNRVSSTTILDKEQNISVIDSARNLSVRGYGPLASFPVGDRSVTRGEYEGPKAPYRRLLISWVAWQQNGRTVCSGHPYLITLSWEGNVVYQSWALC